MPTKDEPWFTLNRNKGVSILHDQYPREACNTDDAEDVEKVDPMTAEALLAGGHARACEHCSPRPEG